MTKLLGLLALTPLCMTGCTTNDTPVTPLAQLAGAQVTLQTSSGSPIIDNGFASPPMVEIQAADDCARVGDDVTIDLDGVRLRAESRGGEEHTIDGSECVPIQFYFDAAPPTGTTTTLLIRDANTTWTIEGTDLFATDFVLTAPPVAGGTAHVVWQSAQQIENGVYAQFTRGGSVMFQEWTDNSAAPPVTVSGNAIDVAIPAALTGDGILSINASRNAKPTRCDGPASCTLRVDNGIDLATTIAEPAVGPDAQLSLARRL